MADVHDSATRSYNMSRIRNKDTKPEIIVRKFLFANGFRYRLNDKKLPGKPDIVLPKYKTVIFVNGCFWHGHENCNYFKLPATRTEWWREKIEGNIRNDIKKHNQLREAGYKVIVIWECEIKSKIFEREIIGSLMIKKYSKIKSQLDIEIRKSDDNNLAYITHYFQNSHSELSETYKANAQKYISDLHKNQLIVSEPELEQYLPICWDVPFPPVDNPRFKFIDLFAGIGGIRLAYQKLGGKCVFTSEWDYFSKKTYEANFGEVPFGDITKIPEGLIPDHDLLLAGFPCQPFSIAGVSKKNSLGRVHGFLDKTQGTLFFDVARIIKHKRPKAFMLENVKNLVSHDKGNTFKVIINTLKELNYSVHYKILDGKHFVPQHRERIIIVGFDKKIYKGNEPFEFPEMPDKKLKVNDILEPIVDDKYTLSNKLWNYLQEYAKKHKAKGNGFGFGLTDLNGISRTMSARYYKDGAEILIPQEGKNPRRLTPRECARLQGFDDKFLIPVSDNQAYKQFGNSVVSPLIHAVGLKIMQIILNNEN